MAIIRKPKTPDQLVKMQAADIRKSYTELANDYLRLVEMEDVLCPKCGRLLVADNGFYVDDRYVNRHYPICKRCVLEEVEQRKSDKDKPNETKQSVQTVLHKMDLPYIDSLYEKFLKNQNEDLTEDFGTPFTIYLKTIKTFEPYRAKRWKDSVFGNNNIDSDVDIDENTRIMKAAKKRFGKDYSPTDLLFLETEYEDWVKRYPCENKAQELLYQRICFIQLAIDKAQKNGDDTKDLDKSLQELMTSLAIKPSSSNSNALTEAKTFGQLIQKWEEEKPIPEPDEDFKDVDKVGLYVDVFFKGHLSKMMGLKNAFSSLYEKFMAKYTVKKPEYEEDTDSEALFDQIFGARMDEETDGSSGE